jgi:hypothetical protein
VGNGGLLSIIKSRRVGPQCHYLNDKSNIKQRDRKRGRRINRIKKEKGLNICWRYDMGIETKEHNAVGSAQMKDSKKAGAGGVE